MQPQHSCAGWAAGQSCCSPGPEQRCQQTWGGRHTLITEAGQTGGVAGPHLDPKRHTGTQTAGVVPGVWPLGSKLKNWPHCRIPAGQIPRPPHPQCPLQSQGETSTPGEAPAPSSPGHHQELVNLLVYEWVVRLPHLGLQFGLVAAILFTCKEETRHRETNSVCRDPAAAGQACRGQGSPCFEGSMGDDGPLSGAIHPPANAGGAGEGRVSPEVGVARVRTHT